LRNADRSWVFGFWALRESSRLIEKPKAKIKKQKGTKAV